MAQFQSELERLKRERELAEEKRLQAERSRANSAKKLRAKNRALQVKLAEERERFEQHFNKQNTAPPTPAKRATAAEEPSSLREINTRVLRKCKELEALLEQERRVNAKLKEEVCV